MFTDRVFLSRYSLEAISAALPAGVIKFSISSIFIGTVSYTGIFVAQYIGAGKPKDASSALWQGLYLSLFFGLCQCLLFFWSEDIFISAGHSGEIVKQETIYLQVLILAAPIELMMVTLSTYLASLGFARVVMWVNLIGTIINIPLDYFLIFGVEFGGETLIPPLGILGAAIATDFSWLFACVLFAIIVFRKNMEKNHSTRSSYALNWNLLFRIVKFGYPSGLQFFLEIFAFAFFAFAVAKLGGLVLAGNNIVFSIEAMSFVPMLGVGQAVSILVGRAIGGQNPKDGEKATISGIVISTIYVSGMLIIFLVIPELILLIFMPENLEAGSIDFLLQLGKNLLKFVIFYSFFDGLYLSCFGAIKGAGDVIFPMVAMGFWAIVGLVIPILILFFLEWANIYTMWCCMSFYVLALTATGLQRFLSRKWMSKSVIELDKLIV
jgi:MATE family multidrug resistance protein